MDDGWSRGYDAGYDAAVLALCGEGAYMADMSEHLTRIVDAVYDWGLAIGRQEARERASVQDADAGFAVVEP
ncbi:MAG: hypothetical protein H0U59_10740 [Gemmatimonadaceae bacterium]|nr:hypothetical protein [Gemmatimonadaceae bacterium]